MDTHRFAVPVLIMHCFASVIGAWTFFFGMAARTF